MDPALLIPQAEPLPIPWAWFDVLLIVTFAAHILFMNALVGSAAIGLIRSAGAATISLETWEPSCRPFSP